MTAALPVGSGRNRLRLWDNQYSLLWDSATDNTPAYRHIASWVNATIDYSDNTRWVGRMYRCHEGIKREAYSSSEYLKYIMKWPEPIFHDSPQSWTNIQPGSPM